MAERCQQEVREFNRARNCWKDKEEDEAWLLEKRTEADKIRKSLLL
jgi:hypothetical protein